MIVYRVQESAFVMNSAPRLDHPIYAGAPATHVAAYLNRTQLLHLLHSRDPSFITHDRTRDPTEFVVSYNQDTRLYVELMRGDEFLEERSVRRFALALARHFGCGFITKPAPSRDTT